MKDVLDTRLLVALFAPEDDAMLRRARERTRLIRKARSGIIPAIVLGEFFHHVCQRAGQASAREACEYLLASGLDIVPLRASTAMEAGKLRCAHRRVPLGDCIVAAVAFEADGRVVSDDEHFREFEGLRVGWL